MQTSMSKKQGIYQKLHENYKGKNLINNNGEKDIFKFLKWYWIEEYIRVD